MISKRILLTLFAVVNGPAAVSGAEILQVHEISDQFEKWDQWIKEEAVVTITGRYEGRVSKQFHLSRFKALCTPARTTVLPQGIRSGQRLTVTGTFRKIGNRYFLDVTRIAAGSTDYDRMTARARRIDKANMDQMYELADEYAPFAEFYKDKDLTELIRQYRQQAFEQQRINARGNPEQLVKLADRGSALGIADRTLQAIRFEALETRRRLPSADLPAVESELRNSFPDWDVTGTLSVDVESRFLKDPVATYEAANDAGRRRFHRRLFRLLRLPIILAELKPDGRNGRDVAERLQKELPEEKQQISRCRTDYVDYRLKLVTGMSRTQLEEIEELLRTSGRLAEFPETLDRYLEAQEKRLNNQQLDSMLLLANEYRFAFERWKRPAHQQKASQILKKAWSEAVKIAPKEATLIEQDLAKLGWVRLNEKWMTDQQMASLPRDNIALAKREGRAVAGMDYQEIIDVMGSPDRRIRVVSAGYVQELWIYAVGGITVHMQRKRFEKPEEAVSLLITRTVR